MRGVFTEQEQRRVFVVVGVFLVVREHGFGIVGVDDFAEEFVEDFVRRDGVAVDFVGRFVGVDARFADVFSE